MPERPHAVLRVEPDTIPQLRTLFQDCIELLEDKLELLNHEGRLVDSWMHDPVSLRMRDLYNERVMDAPDGGYHALVAYLDELKRVHAALGRMQAEYTATEDENAATLALGAELPPHPS